MWKIKPKGAFKRFLRTREEVMHTKKISIVLHRVADFLNIASVSMVNSKVAGTWEESQASWQHRRTDISRSKTAWIRHVQAGLHRCRISALQMKSSQLPNVQLQNGVKQTPLMQLIYRKKKRKKASNRENTISIHRWVKDLQHGRHWEPSVQETLAIWWRKGLGKGSPCDMVGDSSSPSTSTWLSRDLNTSPLMGSHHTG